MLQIAVQVNLNLIGTVEIHNAIEQALDALEVRLDTTENRAALLGHAVGARDQSTLLGAVIMNMRLVLGTVATATDFLRSRFNLKSYALLLF